MCELSNFSKVSVRGEELYIYIYVCIFLAFLKMRCSFNLILQSYLKKLKEKRLNIKQDTDNERDNEASW